MNSTQSMSPDMQQKVQVIDEFRFVYIWVLVAVGLPGNLACLVTVLNMQVTTATFYVGLLAVSDSVALVVKLIYHQLSTYEAYDEAACRTSYLASFCSCYANWVLTLICFERFFAVCFPLKKLVYFTKKKVYISAIVLALSLLAVFVPTFFFFEGKMDESNFCVIVDNVISFKEDIWDAWFVTSLLFYIPFLLMVILTAVIVASLRRYRRARQSIQSSASTSSASVRGELALSVMLICAAVVFLLLNLPTCLYHLFIMKSFSEHIMEERVQNYLIYQVVFFLSDTNHAVNFFIYFVSSAKFRSCFMGIVRRCPCIPKPTDTDKTEPVTQELTHLTDQDLQGAREH